ncbi:putative reverse transcriptase domain-containing protein, partial [Tanacetum coccineum]
MSLRSSSHADDSANSELELEASGRTMSRRSTRSNPANNTNPPNETADEVARQLNTALPNLLTQLVQALRGNRANQGDVTQSCSYKTFRSCGAKEFFDTEGAVGLLTWFKGIEVVLYISKCLAESQVEFASCMLQGRTLTWWNTLVQTQGRATAIAQPWEDFKKLLMEEYCPDDEIQKKKPQLATLQLTQPSNETTDEVARQLNTAMPNSLTQLVQALRCNRANQGDVTQSCSYKTFRSCGAKEFFGTEGAVGLLTWFESMESVLHIKCCEHGQPLTTDGIKDGIFKKKENAGNKKRSNDQFKNQGMNDRNKRQRTGRNFAITTPDQGQGQRQYAFHHSGNFPVCGRCNQVGHFTRYCTGRVINERPRPTCYESGDSNHFRRNCPRMNRATTSEGNRPNPVIAIKGNPNQGNNRNQSRGRAFALGVAGAPQDPNVVTGTFSLNDHLATVLFDSSAYNTPCF